MGLRSKCRRLLWRRTRTPARSQSVRTHHRVDSGQVKQMSSRPEISQSLSEGIGSKSNAQIGRFFALRLAYGTVFTRDSQKASSSRSRQTCECDTLITTKTTWIKRRRGSTCVLSVLQLVMDDPHDPSLAYEPRCGVSCSPEWLRRLAFFFVSRRCKCILCWLPTRTQCLAVTKLA